MRNSICFPFAALCLALQACGGGGGGAAPEAVAAAPVAATPAPAPVVAAAASGVAGLVPAADMTWTTQQNLNLSLTVRDAEGRLAAGAAVRVFALSRLSPQDGSPLEEPVPMALLDSGSTDAAGKLDWLVRVPGHETELLLVATAGAQLGQAVIKTDVATLSAKLVLRP